MELIIFLLSWPAILAGFIGWAWIVIVAFSNEEPIWGLACVFIPFAALVYAVLNIHETKIPLGLYCIGFVVRLVLGLIAISIA